MAAGIIVGCCRSCSLALGLAVSVHSKLLEPRTSPAYESHASVWVWQSASRENKDQEFKSDIARDNNRWTAYCDSC